jgi:arabinan endo-1,5-alpha-L-arabinosidase
VEPDQNFAELDRIDFLRVIRDTIPGNGFDNGIKVRLTKDDKLAVKNGGYAIFENVVTDSIKSTEVKVELQQCSGGTLSIREGSASGTELSKCTVPSSCASGAWTEVNCSATKKLSGVKDFYLTGSGMSGEVLVGNIRFGKIAEPPVSSSSVVPPASSSSVAPVESSSSEVAPESSSSGTTAIAQAKSLKANYKMTTNAAGYTFHFDRPGNYEIIVMNPMGQLMARKTVRMESEVSLQGLPKGKYIFKAMNR